MKQSFTAQRSFTTGISVLFCSVFVLGGGKSFLEHFMKVRLRLLELEFFCLFVFFKVVFTQLILPVVM